MFIVKEFLTHRQQKAFWRFLKENNVLIPYLKQRDDEFRENCYVERNKDIIPYHIIEWSFQFNIEEYKFWFKLNENWENLFRLLKHKK